MSFGTAQADVSSIDGVIARVLQRILALTAAIWHNEHTGQPILRSRTASIIGDQDPLESII
jgi:hypothetical protein